MKHLILYTLLLFGAAGFSSCSDDLSLTDGQNTRSQTSVDGVTAIAGRVNIKVAPEATQSIKFDQPGVVSLQSVPSPMLKTLRSVGTYKVERLFAPCGQYEGRTKAAGLDRWYTVYFDEKQDLQEAIKRFERVDQIQKVEKVIPVALPKTQQLSTPSAPRLKEAAVAPFNDPRLQEQWHYHNDGTLSNKSKAGADCNVWPVWKKYTTGKPNVVVAIIDGGIEVNHEDLKASMHINQIEMDGTPGVDDDGNGFVDDIYGYNFVEAQDVVGGKIEPDEGGHGTHVAGTVAARNNNGVGVGGIAGGDGTANSGVRLLSCQIFRKRGEEGDAAKAIKYAADNGAVIAQCSWGYNSSEGVTQLPASLKEAMDYFIQYAGCDNQGNQKADSPMKGGVMIFAAGNEDKEFEAFPASYPKVISVSSMAWDFSKASYSNYADWVSIMAPGGDQDVFGLKGGVLSTVPKRNDSSGYGFMQGTSMACPHVSGIAALVVSYFGQQGFTNDQLKARLMSAFRPYNIDELNPSYKGKLGRGFIDAEAAFAEDKGIAPAQVSGMSVTPDYVTLDLKWSVASDGDDQTATFYNVYISDKALNAAALASLQPIRINGTGYPLGSYIKHRFESLRDNTTYYMAIVAVDRWGHTAPPAFVEGTTKLNHAPVINGFPQGQQVVSGDAKSSFSFSVNDPDGHKWEYQLTGDTKGVVAKRADNQINITIWPILSAGEYQFTFTATDDLGAATSQVLKFKVGNQTPTQLATAFENLIIGLDEGTKTISLPEHYQYASGERLHFSVVSGNEKVVKATSDAEGRLELRAVGKGTTKVQVRATDSRKSVVESSFQVRVVDHIAAPVYMVYPIPVKRDLNALLNPKLTSATFIISTPTGEEVLRRTVSANALHVASVDLSKLAPATYRLTILTAQGKHQQLFIKR